MERGRNINCGTNSRIKTILFLINGNMRQNQLLMVGECTTNISKTQTHKNVLKYYHKRTKRNMIPFGQHTSNNNKNSDNNDDIGVPEEIIIT